MNDDYDEGKDVSGDGSGDGGEYSAGRTVGRFLFYSMLIVGEWVVLAWYVFWR